MSTNQGPRSSSTGTGAGRAGRDAGGRGATRLVTETDATSGAGAGGAAPTAAAGAGGAARAAAVGLWGLVGAGLAYGVVQTVIRATQLFA